MSTVEISLGVILLIFSVAIIILVLMQEAQQQNVGAVTGSSDAGFSKGKSRSKESTLSRWTKIVAIAFFILVIAINAFMFLRPVAS